MPKFYITTAIDYSNGDPHLGHALEKVGADCIARYRRLRGDDVHFLMGMDEHSQAVLQAAEQNGVTPRVWVDRMATTFEGYWQRLECSNDDWIRTTEPRHHRDGHGPAGADRPGAAGGPLRGRVRGTLLLRMRGVQAAGPDRERPLHRASHPGAGAHEGAEPLLPAEPVSRPAADAHPLRGVPGRAGDPSQRDRAAARGRPAGHLGVPQPAVVGHPLPRRRRADGVRLVRRADQLPLGHRLSRARVRAALAGRPARGRQGHHPVPLRHLAGDAPQRRTAASQGGLGPRVRAVGRRPRCPSRPARP